MANLCKLLSSPVKALVNSAVVMVMRFKDDILCLFVEAKICKS